MPTTYAHYRFGETVRRQLPESIQRIIKENEELFEFVENTEKEQIEEIIEKLKIEFADFEFSTETEEW